MFSELAGHKVGTQSRAVWCSPHFLQNLSHCGMACGFHYLEKISETFSAPLIAWFCSKGSALNSSSGLRVKQGLCSLTTEKHSCVLLCYL